MMKVETVDPAQAFEASVRARMKPVNELTARGNSAVQQFYSGATVFLTGGSGYLGKQLIEKLLRATKVSKIFFLLRSKKGKSMRQRLIEMLEDPLYDVLREQQPNFAEKLFPVSGDVAELRLGLSEKDWDAITEQADIIFHLAATTRFDETLLTATLINVRGTREALLLGKTCKNLRSFVYVSTAYSHACLDRINTDISENFYKSPISPIAMIQLVETVEEAIINNMTPSLTNNWPNTYTFSKSVAEELINTIGNDLPICVVRPAIVACTKLEPSPGWVDMSCLYGISGLLTAVGLGVMHAVYLDNETQVELVPVDFVNNAIIAAGWKTAWKQAAGDSKTKIYAVSSYSRNPFFVGEMSVILKKENRKYPTPMTVGHVFKWNSNNPILFWIYSWLLHLIPAYIIDGIMVISGKQRRFVKLASKMYKMSSALSPFTCHYWKFDDKNTTELYDNLSKEDQMIFNFDTKEYIDWKEYMIIWIIGLRKYILKDGLTGTLYARKKARILKFITYILMPLYFYSLYKVVCLALSLLMLIIL